jgi:hypothetical protein
MNRQWQRYKELELIPDQPLGNRVNPPTMVQSATGSSTVPRSWLRALWEIIDIALLRNLESRVWQRIDPHTGKTQWHIYDPASGQTQRLNSTTEVCQWLEQVFQR